MARLGLFGGRVGLWELLILLAVVLIIFGPRKLPEIGRSLGRGIKEFRRGAKELSAELRENTDINDEEEKIR